MKLIEKWVLKNAIDHNGKAVEKAVISKILGEDPSLRSKLQELIPEIGRIVKKVNSMSSKSQENRLKKIAPELLKEEKKEERGLPDLKNAKDVVMRLAPFPSGPLHIGNARMAVLNDEYVKKYKGKLLLVFDDTIGSLTGQKEILPESYDIIKKDLKWLGVDYKDIVFKSDRLQIYYDHAKKLLRQGYAYVCKCSSEDFTSKYKVPGEECPCRSRLIGENIDLFERMLKGNFAPGKIVVRLKTGMKFPDPAIRDHVILRISNKPHPKVGTKFKVWPTMEFSWGIDNHLLGITHVLNGKDMMKSDKIGKQICDLFNWQYPEYLHYGFLSMALSKSELKKLKAKGKMTYDDPRTWTLLSLEKRGIQPQAVRNFIIGFGLSLADIEGSPELLYAENKKIVEPKANRYFFVDDSLKIKITKYTTPYQSKAPLHPDYKKGFRNYKIDTDDVIVLINKRDKPKTGEKLRLKNLMNIKIKRKSKGMINAEYIGNDITQKMPKIQWVFDKEKVVTEIVMPDASIKKGYSEKAVLNLKSDTLIQNIRFGFCRVDSVNKKVIEYFTHK